MDVDGLLSAAAVLPLAAGILVIAVGLGRLPLAGRAAPGDLAAAVGLGLEFLLAAGLLRLSALDDFQAIGVVAAIVLLRKLVTRGIAYAVIALQRG